MSAADTHPAGDPAAAGRRLRVAFIGKGGSGKSAISGTVCRLLARAGWTVLALDIDTVPGLAMSLGAAPGEARLPLGLASLVEGRRGRRWSIHKGAGAARLVDTYSRDAPDGVRLLELGKLPGRVEPESTVAFRHVLERFRRPGWAMVADLAAGTRQPVFGWSSFAPLRIAVTEPTAKGLGTVRRLSGVATHMVVNKVREHEDVERAREAVALPIAGVVPWDDTLADAERQGYAPLDYAPDCPAVNSVGQLTAWLQGHL